MRKERTKLVEDGKPMSIDITPIPYGNPMKPRTLSKMVKMIPSTKDNQALLCRGKRKGTDIIFDDEDPFYR